jgi:hypothetical protein
MDLVLHPERYAIVRLPPETVIADVVPQHGVVAIVRSARELSIWMPEKSAPADATMSTDWRLLSIVGPLDLGLTGILASVLVPLAEAGVSVFPFASYDTDWIGIPAASSATAVSALEAAGHSVART